MRALRDPLVASWATSPLREDHLAGSGRLARASALLLMSCSGVWRLGQRCQARRRCRVLAEWFGRMKCRACSAFSAGRRYGAHHQWRKEPVRKSEACSRQRLLRAFSRGVGTGCGRGCGVFFLLCEPARSRRNCGRTQGADHWKMEIIQNINLKNYNK